MSTVLQLALLACAVILVVFAGKIHIRLTHLDTSLGKLLAFLDGVSVERRKEQQDERNGSGIFRKTMVDVLMSCRSSIDAIRSVLDELSIPRRDTVEMQRPLRLPALDAGRDRHPPETVAEETARKPEAPSASRMRHAVQRPAICEPTSDAGQHAAGLSRPKSRGPEPAAARPVPTDAPPRSQTMRGIPGPQGTRPLPVVVPPPMGPPRSTATLPSMGVVSPPRGTAASPAGAQEGKEA